MGMKCHKRVSVIIIGSKHKSNLDQDLFSTPLPLFRLGRSNANGVDLNRNFPRQFDEPQNNLRQLRNGREPETLAVMDWITRNPFVLSANLHAGAVVASYPFDDSPRHRTTGFYSTAPDDQTFKYLAKTYARNHREMHKNVRCTRADNFPGGITNGAQWYDVPGGMQVYQE